MTDNLQLIVGHIVGETLIDSLMNCVLGSAVRHPSYSVLGYGQFSEFGNLLIGINYGQMADRSKAPDCKPPPDRFSSPTRTLVIPRLSLILRAYH